MSSIKVILYTSKTLSNGEHPIMLRVIKDRKAKYMSIGYSCTSAMWDEDNNLPVRKHPLYKEISILIDKKKIEANKLILNLENDDKSFSSEEIKKKLTKSYRMNKISVFEYFDEIIERFKRSGRIGYAKVFKNTKNSISTFRNGKDLSFSDINISFLLKYEENFYSRGVLPNSVFVFMRTFKTLINYAKREELIRDEFDPFKEYSFRKFRGIKTKKRAISKEDIHNIAELSLDPESSLYHSRNFFLFSFYCRGLSFIDLAYLKWSDINGSRLQYVRKKTKELFNISLLDPAIEILKYYNNIYYNGEESYLFPILDESHDTPTKIDNRIHKLLRKTNKDLKIIGEKANIKGKLTTYVARHSFATILKYGGISTAIISEALGHESEKITQVYLDSFENNVLDEATKVIL